MVAVVLVLAGCAGHGGASDVAVTAPAVTPSSSAAAPSTAMPAAPTGAPTAIREPAVAPGHALIATATVDQVAVLAGPGGGADRTQHLAHPNQVGAPRTFLVEQVRGDWLQVLLPVRPNGSTGWIRADDVILTQTVYSVEVDLADFELRVSEGDDVVVRTEIGYGAEDTPTPGGRYYLVELLQPPDPDGVYGPYAFGLSGFSDVHRDFAGGEGVIGIHGTNDPTSIGSRVSNGCIRMANDVITELATMLPLGTPVTIIG